MIFSVIMFCGAAAFFIAGLLSFKEKNKYKKEFAKCFLFVAITFLLSGIAAIFKTDLAFATAVAILFAGIFISAFLYISIKKRMDS